MTAVSEQAYTQAEGAADAAALVWAAGRSVAELEAHGIPTARIRMHPLDGETIVASQFPGSVHQRLLRLLGHPVVEDEACRLGWPVAEFDPPKRKRNASTAS